MMKTPLPEAWVSSSYEETLLYGKNVASRLASGAVLALLGELGSGKTSFVKGLAEGLAISNDNVCSPTFSLLNIYEGCFPLYHFDLYRLPSAHAFFEAGFDEYLSGNGICCIEWPDKILTQLPSHTLLITFSHLGLNKRSLQLTSLTT